MTQPGPLGETFPPQTKSSGQKKEKKLRCRVILGTGSNVLVYCETAVDHFKTVAGRPSPLHLQETIFYCVFRFVSRAFLSAVVLNHAVKIHDIQRTL